MPRALSDALLAAALTAVLLTPIFGLHIRVDGVNVSLNRTPMPVIVAVAIVFLLRLFQQPLQRLWAKLHPADAWRSNPLATGLRSVTERPNTRLALWLLLLAAAMIWPFTASRGAVDVMTLALIYVMLGLGLNIVVGFAGLLVLGYAAFYAVGAYTYAYLAQQYGLSFWWGLPLAGGLAALTGFLLGLPHFRRHCVLSSSPSPTSTDDSFSTTIITPPRGGPGGDSQLVDGVDGLWTEARSMWVAC